MTAVSVDFRSKDLPALKLDSKDVKAFVSGSPKTFDEAKPEVEHRLVTTKRHFFYNRQVSQLRAVNRTAMKFADVDCGSPIEQLCAVHFESTAAIALLRDGTVAAVVASDMPDKTVKLALTPLLGEEKKIANATAICVVQSQSTSHSTSSVWAHKQILVFSGGAKKDQPLTITRIIPAADGASAEKVETIAAANAWANTFGAVSFASAGQNGFVAICGANGGKVQVVHQADLAKGVLNKPLTPHNELGAQSAIFLPRDSVTSDADPTLLAAAAQGATDFITTTATGGHEIRLWGLSGKSVNLIQTIAIAGDKDNGNRENIVDGSTSDMTFLISKNNGANGTIIAIEPDTDRTSFRRITEWDIPEAAPILSCSACPAPTTGVSSQASRFCVFVRTSMGVYRYTFDNRISGTPNVSGFAADSDKKDESSVDNKKPGGDNVSKWFGGAAAASGDADSSNVDPAIVSKSSKEVVSVKAGQRTTTVEGTSSKEVKAAVDSAVADATQQHLVSAGRFYEQSDAVVQSLEQALGQALGSLRIPAVRQRSNEVAAEWARKATRAIEDAVRTAMNNGKSGASSSSAAAATAATSISGFSPTLAQNFYTTFLENIHAAASTVVDHSLDKLLETAVTQAIDKVWPAVQNVVDQMNPAPNTATGNQIPRVSALPSFINFSESIQADQARQNAAVKRQVEQNKRDLAMYESTTGSNIKSAEQYLAKLQTAVQGLNSAVEAAKAPTTIGGTSAVTPANEDEVFAKVHKLAKEGNFQSATNIIANGGSVSLVTRFFDNSDVDHHFEAVCSPKGMSAASFVTILRLLSRGLTSSAAVALTARVNLIKKIVVPYALAIDEDQNNGTNKDAVSFLQSARSDIEDARNELNRVQGPDRQTVKNAKLALSAMNIFDETA